MFDFPRDMARVPAQVNRLSNQVLVTTYEAGMGQGPPMIARRTVLAGLGLPLLGCGKPAEITGALQGAGAQRGHLLRERRSWPAPAPAGRVRVLIAGGGVAGLAAARALRQRGIEDFALLELEDAAGGNSRGGEIAGIACPLGAHYLPLPGDDAPQVQDLLQELGLRSREAGRWVYDERHLCHAPQERLFFHGSWHEGLLPVQGVAQATLSQYRRFASRVEAGEPRGPLHHPGVADALGPPSRPRRDHLHCLAR